MARFLTNARPQKAPIEMGRRCHAVSFVGLGELGCKLDPHRPTDISSLNDCLLLLEGAQGASRPCLGVRLLKSVPFTTRTLSSRIQLDKISGTRFAPRHD
jgi:hypothetical protein